MLRQRNDAWAHADVRFGGAARLVLELERDDWLDRLTSRTDLWEQWVPPGREELLAIAQLAEKLLAIYSEEANDLRDKLLELRS